MEQSVLGGSTAQPVPHGRAEGTHRFLAHDELLHLLHLGHVVLVGLQLALADALVDPDQHLPRDVLTIIHPWGTSSVSRDLTHPGTG